MIIRSLGSIDSLDVSRLQIFVPIVSSLDQFDEKKINYKDFVIKLLMNTYRGVYNFNLLVHISKLEPILYLIFDITKAILSPKNKTMIRGGRCFFRIAVDAGFGMPQRKAALQPKFRWRTLTECERADPLLVAVFAAADKTEAQMDQMFRSWSRL